MSKEKRPGYEARTKAAEYGYLEYPSRFSDIYFSENTITHTVSNIKRYLTRNAVWWGNYQQYAPDNPFDPNAWGNTKLYEDWNSAVDEAREDLAKFPPVRPGPDPDAPGALADNMQDHLDKAIRIALFDKFMPNATEPGVPIEVKVQLQPPHGRRHGIITEWVRNPYLYLKITMFCPHGGWVGAALWKSYNHFQLGKVKEYRATYRVPAEPDDLGQILFVFNGLESLPSQTATPAILQPVLQWTNEPGTPSRWAVRSWYVPASYMPPFNQMPLRGVVRPFNPNDITLPAWTTAQTVNVGDTIEGVIQWDGAQYVSSMFRNGQEMARLEVPGIAPLIYPVAVIEAYMPPQEANPWPQPVPKKGLVDIDMTRITIKPITSNAPVTPHWDVGEEDQSHKYGTNRLRRYKVTPNYGGVPTTSLDFKAK